MNSKEALKRIYNDAISMNEIEEDVEEIKKDYELIKQDLDRLEQLEKERQEVETRLSSKETNTFDEIATMIKKANDYDVLVNKCKQLEKALEKSCELLDYTCPVEEELIDDLDCENCEDNYKECWKIFFLKEVLK